MLNNGFTDYSDNAITITSGTDVNAHDSHLVYNLLGLQEMLLRLDPHVILFKRTLDAFAREYKDDELARKFINHLLEWYDMEGQHITDELEAEERNHEAIQHARDSALADAFNLSEPYSLESLESLIGRFERREKVDFIIQGAVLAPVVGHGIARLLLNLNDAGVICLESAGVDIAKLTAWTRDLFRQHGTSILLSTSE